MIDTSADLQRQRPAEPASRKRFFRPPELEGKFKAKTDFIKYFKEGVSASFIIMSNHPVCQLQLYLPPDAAINKDFLKLVLADEKDLLELSEVKQVNVPLYDELAVGKLWPLLQQNAGFMRYFPDKFPKGRVPDRGYFFNVLNTVEHNYLQDTIAHANEMRNAAKDKDQEYCQIKVSDKWWGRLNKIPWISSKYPVAPNLTFRVQGPHALAAQAGLEARAPRAQAEEDRPHGHTRAVPRRSGSAGAGARRRRGDERGATPDALTLPEERDAAEEEQERERLMIC